MRLLPGPRVPHPANPRRVEQVLPRGHGPDRLDESVALDVLEQITRGALLPVAATLPLGGGVVVWLGVRAATAT
ncbi:hypothetical protein [Ornithinimicrobium cryptoxanthini]|uniref:Uncharacterized protein n=1 Tax=Ornithinimicrobium cryptoxanthini TaxID=2934161 RepID=A0ABY4YIM9_9MICO|nr:hypothetical protein [Ornithinimicrobium cryptoxanthini]USQ76553.1 hypothetical protein NF557_01060 [Ornithinimicrobium cryptoxanthini]